VALRRGFPTGKQKNTSARLRFVTKAIVELDVNRRAAISPLVFIARIVNATLAQESSSWKIVSAPFRSSGWWRSRRKRARLSPRIMLRR